MAVIRDTDHLRSLLVKTDEAWSPDTQIAHYDERLAECEADDRRIARALMRADDFADADAIVEVLRQDSAKNNETRAKWAAKRAEAVAEKERRAEREARLAAFVERANAARETLDDLTADQRRSILRDLHPTIHIGCRDDTHHPGGWPRGVILGDLAEGEAGAAGILGRGESNATNWVEDGQHWVRWSAEEGWDPATDDRVPPLDEDPEEVVDSDGTAEGSAKLPSNSLHSL